MAVGEDVQARMSKVRALSATVEALSEGQDNVLMAVRLHFKECTDEGGRVHQGISCRNKRMDQ
jgi:hypothetical protein